MAVWSETSISDVSISKRIDGEYFHPEYIAAESIVLLNSTKTLKVLGKFLIGPFGSAFHVTNYDSNSPFRYIRGKDVKPFQLLEDDNVYMPPKDYERLSKYAVKKDDLLISVVGTLGNVAVVPEGLKGIFSCKSTIFRDSSVEPYFLLAYFNSKYGRNCLLRRQRGAIQTGLNKDDLEQVPVPIFNNKIQIEIGSLVRVALEKNQLAKSLYVQAQELLENELRLDQLVLEKSKSYETSFSEVVNGGRIDAEFYHAKYKPYLQAIQNYTHGFIPLKYLVNIVMPNFKALNHKNQKVEYLEIGDVDISDGSYNTNLIYSTGLPANAKIKLNGGEILISKVRPTRGAITIIDNELENKMVSSGAFFVCTAKEPIQREIIWLYLRIIRNLFEKDCSGTSYPTIDSHYLANFPCPLFQDSLAVTITNLIIQSKQAKKVSEQLLAQAKKRVEDLIEGASK